MSNPKLTITQEQLDAAIAAAVQAALAATQTPAALPHPDAQVNAALDKMSNAELAALLAKAEAERFGGNIGSRSGAAVRDNVIGGAGVAGGFIKGLIFGQKTPAQERAELLKRIAELG